MALPITGPFTRNVSTRFASPYQAYVANRLLTTWYRQRKPYNLPLTYSSDNCRQIAAYGPYQFPAYMSATSTSVVSPWSVSSNQSAHTQIIGFRNDAQNAAYKRFMAAQGDTASWLVSLAEHRQALQMMENRLFQLARFVKAINGFRFGEAFNAILSKHDRDGWNRAHRLRNSGLFKRGASTSGDLILESLFGWAPLASDIYAAAQILSGPVRPQTIKGRGSREWKNVTDSLGGVHTGFCRVQMICEVSVENYNLFLANKLGLVNPLVALYELVPWSFVANYFVNIEEFLSQWSGSVGLTYSNQHYTRRVQDRSVFVGGPSSRNEAIRDSVSRSVGTLPGVTLKVRPPWNLSPRRGLVAAGLLLQQLRDSDPPLRPRRLVTASERKRHARMAAHFSLTGDARD